MFVDTPCSQSINAVVIAFRNNVTATVLKDEFQC